MEPAPAPWYDPRMQYELGIIGAGNMAEAIVRGVLGAGVFMPSQLIAADVSASRRELFTGQLQVRTVQESREVARSSRILLLCVKPFHVQPLLADLQTDLPPHALLISIAAGIATARIEQALGDTPPRRVVRAMPNTPMLVAEGMVAICAGAHAQPQDLAAARRIFQTAARVVEVTEDKMDAVTAVSGSGPAYFYYLVEHMIQAGRELGLDAEQASILARQTALGAARLLLDSADTPAELRRKVTTPNGTTAAAIATFDQHRMGATITQAIHAAARRSAEMGA